MSFSNLTKQTARRLMSIIDPWSAVFGSGNAQNMPLFAAVIICVIGLALLGVAILIPIAYFTG